MRPHMPLRGAIILVGMLRPICDVAFAGEPTKAVRLLSVVSDPKRSYKDREAAVESLAKLSATEVLPPLADIIDAPERKQPLGLNAQHDALDPDCQVTQELEKVWQEHCDSSKRIASDGAVTTLVKLLGRHLNSKTIVRSIDSMRSFDPFLRLLSDPDPDQEAALLAIFRNPSAEAPVRYAAANGLADFGIKYEPEIVAAASRSSFDDKVALVEVAAFALEQQAGAEKFDAELASPRNAPKAIRPRALDPLLAETAYQLIDQEGSEPISPRPGCFCGGSYPSPPYTPCYDSAVRFGRVVSVDFRPKMDPGLDLEKMQAFDRQTVQNARDWWSQHKGELTTRPSSSKETKQMRYKRAIAGLVLLIAGCSSPGVLVYQQAGEAPPKMGTAPMDGTYGLFIAGTSTDLYDLPLKKGQALGFQWGEDGEVRWMYAIAGDSKNRLDVSKTYEWRRLP